MPHTCRNCNASFSTEAKLRRHIDRQHDGDAGGPVKGRMGIIVGVVAALVVAGVLASLFLGGGAAMTREANLEAFAVEDDPYVGDPNASVVVVAMEAPTCPACASFHRNILPELQRAFFDEGDAVLYYSHSRIDPDSDMQLGIGQECMFRLGGNEAFWFTTDLYYNQQGAIHPGNMESVLRDRASAVGIEPDDLSRCLDESGPRDAVSDDWSTAEDHDARGTPTFFVFGPEGEAVKANAGNVGGMIQDFISRA